MLQRTEEWHQARLGKLTASRIDDATARTKTGWGASRGDYMAELIIERDTGLPYPQHVSGDMQWGTEQEPNARIVYAMSRNTEIVDVGFVEHPSIPMSGASPDGLIGDDGLVEIKCPKSKKHLGTLLGEAIDGEYVKQMQWQMACTGRKWCDFVSYDPRFSINKQLKIVRVERDDEMIAKLEADARTFLAELADKEAVLRSAYDLRAVLEEAAA